MFVMIIQLTNLFNNLSGSVPVNKSYFLLKLEILFVRNNEFSGHIPSNIGDCSNLQYLSLENNRFSGFIPRSIGNLTKLKKIYIGANGLEGKFLHLII